MDNNTTTIRPKAHKGLLREDLILLRHTFDLHLGRSRAGFNQVYADRRGQNLPESMIKGLLIISFHIEGQPDQPTKESGRYQVGLSVLDTRHLQCVPVDMQSTLQTYHFCVGPERYFKKKSWNFCFGQSRHVTIDDIRREIQKLVAKRNVVLVVHGGKDDLQFIKAAKIHFRQLYTVDTQKSAQNPLDLDYQCSVERMLTLLGCPFDPGMLHNAGNDMNLTLRALLLIATVDAKNDTELKPGCEALLSALERIATEDVPLEEFQRQVKAQLRREHNSAQSRRERKNIRVKEEKRVKQGKKACPKACSTIKNNDQDLVQAACTCKHTSDKRTARRSRANVTNKKEPLGEKHIEGIFKGLEIEH
ncbi:hypothetical protein LSUB1_G007974 [Lachnellula subtilissima]|uniref:Gfd2/YDR514C-like C-terminal domain-containing protein n=1 Tax=Lachnellula subtilissima TaxID=602034 RepID=A0A8H8RCN3_9HELO|nr:hypothetical protein LSUB1_G007974 [Lachnellula subtilissima]